jgi:dienelactone hydrolase
LPAFTPWDVKALEKPPTFEWADRSGKVHSLFFQGEPYRGKATRVFAFYASPITLGAEKPGSQRYPAMVLVHGGGGHAFRDWVSVYARRGYAAIAMDLGGQMGDGNDLKPLPDGGPPQDNNTKFRMSELPDRDQWTYHAVADVLRAHSLIRTFPEVDTTRTGVMGISWGGYLTCIVAGLDHRFKAALPMYGCGFLAHNSSWVKPHLSQLSDAWREKWVRLWDPSSYVGSATMPMFFVNGSNDLAYPLDSYAKTYALVRSPKNIRIEVGMRHGHWFDQKECLRFFDSQLKGEPALPHVVRVITTGDRLEASAETPLRLAAASLSFTTGPHSENGTRPWTTRPLEVVGLKVKGQAPPRDATVAFVTVTDDRGYTATSELFGPAIVSDVSPPDRSN